MAQLAGMSLRERWAGCLLLSFIMKSTSCRVPGTIALGKVSSFFGFQWIFAIRAPSGTGFPLAGMPDW